MGRKTRDTATNLWKASVVAVRSGSRPYRQGYRGGQHGTVWLQEGGAFRMLELKDPSSPCVELNAPHLRAFRS